jgi:hypothetical protein
LFFVSQLTHDPHNGIILSNTAVVESAEVATTYAILLALKITAHSHTQACTDAGGAVASTKGVILTLLTLGETCQQKQVCIM